jgi:hypothetical protein
MDGQVGKANSSSSQWWYFYLQYVNCSIIFMEHNLENSSYVSSNNYPVWKYHKSEAFGFDQVKEVEDQIILRLKVVIPTF